MSLKENLKSKWESTRSSKKCKKVKYIINKLTLINELKQTEQHDLYTISFRIHNSYEIGFIR